MIGLLMNFVLMGIVLSGLLKTYYFFPLLSDNPEMTGTVGLMIMLIIIWIFPKIIGLFIKFAIFCAIVFFIGNFMGLNMDIFKDSSNVVDKIAEKTKELTDVADKIKLSSEANQSFSATPSRVNTGRNIQFGNESVQLYGIDAPDLAQPCKNSAGVNYNCGQVSKEQLEKLTIGKSLNCVNKGKNVYGQPVASCSVDGEDLASLMVRSGWAVADPSITDAYVADEKIAYHQKTGLWNGKFHSPWRWRMRQVNSNLSKTKKSNFTNKKNVKKSESAKTPFQKVMDFFK
ncbi:MAG: thermonuclease family protein [Alphaproteobacteria bacterium]|nr:thermonuclease family protein [Alphaproteobacteria bacterium]